MALTLDKMSGKQKIGFLVAGVVIISLVLVLVAMLLIGDGSDGGNGGEKIISETEGTYVNENGDTVTVETVTNANGDTTTRETKEDAYGNVTTTDPELITTYFPYQVVREHEGYGATMRYFLSADSEKKIIKAMIEECDMEGDKALVREYINNIPLDLSEYTVNYETFTVDAVCEV